MIENSQAAFVWDIIHDQIAWESNVSEVLGLSEDVDISSSVAFHNMIALEHIARRMEMILGQSSNKKEEGVPYRLQYRFRPDHQRGTPSIWVEEFGRWWPGDDGRAFHARGLVRVVSDQYVQSQRGQYSSDHDELTGQLTRMRLMETLTTTINQAKLLNRPGVFMVASVNNLSVINETLGFGVGDEMIAAAGRAIQSKLRQGSTVGRYSSNKFGIILHDYNAEQMELVANRLMTSIRELNVFTKVCNVPGTISIGGVSFPNHVESASQALNCALYALDQARQTRGDSFVSYEPNGTRENKRHRSMAISDEILSALRDDRISVDLQPMICATSGETTYYECLARLFKMDGSAISPSEFMPVSEELGLSRLIDQRVLEITSDLLKRHQKLSFSINVSGLTTCDPDWIGELCGLFQYDRHLAERLIIEITETAMIEDVDQALAFIDTVKELGCRVAIDDFGAGYTSFKNLKRFPVDMVKIDGSFVKNLASDAGDQVFVKAMAELAKTFGMEIVAEWVVDQESAQILRDCGITYLQGYLFGEPFAAQDLNIVQLATTSHGVGHKVLE